MENFLRQLSTSILLLLIVHCSCKSSEDEMQEYADKREIISNIFKPIKQIGTGSFSFVYEGLLNPNKISSFDLNNKTEKDSTKNTKFKLSIPKMLVKTKSTPITTDISAPINTTNWKPIAMKILKAFDRSRRDKIFIFKRECKVYTKLLADKNQTVERYGILAVWFKGVLTMSKSHPKAIGLTLCNVLIYDKYQQNGRELEPIDLLTIFYQMNKILKYIHGKGVVHNDIKSNNLMAKGAQLFLIDFNIAGIIDNEDSSSLSKLNGKNLYYANDLERLLFVIIQLAGIEIPDQNSLKFSQVEDYCMQIWNGAVFDVLTHYHGEVTKCRYDKKIFDYNDMDDRILDAIKKINGSRDPLFSWLSDEEKEEGKKNMIPIESISGPSRIYKKKEPELARIVSKIMFIIPSKKKLRRISSDS